MQWAKKKVPFPGLGSLFYPKYHPDVAGVTKVADKTDERNVTCETDETDITYNGCSGCNRSNG